MKRKALFKNPVNYGYFFILPAVIFMLLMIGYPIIYNLIISVQDVTNLTLAKSDRDFVGLENFVNIFHDPSFLRSVKQTLIYTVGCLVIQFSIGFLMAIFFSKEFKCSKTVRSLIVISWMLPMTVTALIWKFMLSEVGIINFFLLKMHLISEPITWLIKGDSAMWGLILANSWVGIPFNMLLLTTGLNNISPDIYEAASIDGTNAFQKFFYLTVPMLKNTIMSVLVLGFVYTFKVFDLVFVMTGGGPVDATEVISTYSYKRSFKFYNFGEGAAAATILSIILLIIALFYLKSVNDEEK